MDCNLKSTVLENNVKRPNHLKNTDGKNRKVGIEIEFIGIPLPQAAKIITDVFEGSVQKNDEYVYTVSESPYGSFKVECDSTFVKSRKYQSWLSKLGIDLDREELKKMDRKIAEGCNILVPFEIVTPPISMDEIPKFEQLINKLKQAKKQSDSFTFSLAPCGLHINIEITSMDVNHIKPVLQSFCNQYEDLIKEIDVDKIRRLAPYIAPFPKEYTRLLNDKDYSPDLDTFFNDYLDFNPTRNRALDLTPIIGEYSWPLLEKYAEKGLELNLIKPRPAFHYRLPNCHLDEQEWSFTQEWERWVGIEDLAFSSNSFNDKYVNFHKINKGNFNDIFS